MQQKLFEYTAPPRRERTSKTPQPEDRDDCDWEAPCAGLFGPVESKAQARKRARRIVVLLGAIEEAPSVIQCCNSHIAALEYFVEKSLRIELGPNDRDGLLRLVGDTEEVLTEEDCEEMRANSEIWRPYIWGWIGSRPGQMYAAALHAKEVAYLRHLQGELREEVAAIIEGEKDCQAELASLRAIGPLPEDVARRYALTAHGERALSSCLRHA